MKHCSKTNDFNSIISVSSCRKLDFNGWLGLDVVNVRGASELDCIRGSGVRKITGETSF